MNPKINNIESKGAYPSSLLETFYRIQEKLDLKLK